jgi:hypothetical protein
LDETAVAAEIKRNPAENRFEPAPNKVDPIKKGIADYNVESRKFSTEWIFFNSAPSFYI